ncbi:MAG: hypothetical protein CMC74_11385 [Flavobacteriaceae bacterium]|nr:hypothetical protein [Flavobacteriaceae bacterium]
MSDVKVLSFDFRSADNTILAATFGRGMFTGTFEAAASDPEISFDTTTGTTIEGSNCSYTDYDVNLSIALGASADADVNFSVNGSSTATDGIDFELMTSSVTFPAGSTSTQTMTVRVYEDGILEGDESVVIDFTVNANGGDAVANTSADTFTLTINNDDDAPNSVSSTTLYSEDFEGGSYNVTTSSNSGTPWAVGNTATASSTYWDTTGNSTNFAFTNDDACNCDKSNDRLTTTVIDMNGAYSSASLSFDHAFADVIAAEAGTVRISTNGTTYTTIQTLSNTSINNGSGSYTTPWVNTVTVDLSTYIGQSTVYIQFLYNDGNDWSYGMAVDNILVTASGNTGVQTAVNTGTPDQLNVNQMGTAYAQDPGTNDVMTAIVDNDGFDYGCVDVAVSRSGTGAQAYNGSVLPDLVADKTFTFTPSNTTSSGDNTLIFFFEEAEIAGWEAATGLNRNADLVIGREVGAAILETSSVTIGSFGSNVTVLGNFTGLEGTYYFGTSDSFVGCAGTVKTWNGSSWSPVGAPDTTNPVVLAGNYSTLTHGDLEACTLTVNAGNTLTVGASSYALIHGNITVDGSLIVEHQGSLVQEDNDAIVTNNGTINVLLTSPNLASRDFMVMGSPMSAETRTGVWNSAFLVLNHDTNNFVPNPAVAAAFPLAENFADDNYDNWNPYSGAITVGEGYIVRPQAGYGQPGGIFNFTYEQGTLNNGVVNFNVIYNTPGTPSENKNASPNIVANPYASAISAVDFINANAMVDELYFWEHNTPPSQSMPGAGAMNFSMEDISMRNLFGGTAAASGGTAPTEFISTGQGFGFKANAAGTAVFNNSMRRTDNNDTFRNSMDADRIWLKVSEATYEMGNTTLVGFSEVTSEEEDAGYDTRRLATVVSLFSHLQDGTKEFGIQALGAFETSAKIPMGFSTLIDAELEYTISMENVEGANLDLATVYLMDNQLGILTDLTAEDYLFRSGKGTYPGRFTLLFEQSPLGVTEFNENSVAMYPNPSDGQLTIISKQALVETITVYDLQGRKVMTYEGGTSVVHINMSHLNASVYFVEVKTTEGTVNKRIIKK